jgi:hypothetical protein
VRYGVDGDGDDVKDRYDPADAIPGTANLLRQNGAPGDYGRATFACNHAGWYVDAVLSPAARPQDDWDASAGRSASELGWIPTCGASGVRPACPLKPALEFIGYDGYPGHGSPPDVLGRMPGADPRLVGLGLLRLERPGRAVRLGDGVPRPGSRRPRPALSTNTTNRPGTVPSRRLWRPPTTATALLAVNEISTRSAGFLAAP